MKKVLLMGLALVLALSLAGCTINILPAATLQGSVEFEGGDPAVNAKVTLTPASAAGTSWVTYTDAAGNWTTGRKIRPESYTIEFEHTDADESVTINFVVALPFKTYTVPLQTLPFTEGGTTGLNASGTVIWDHDDNPLTALVPLLGASVQVDGAVTKSAYTDSTGTWKINNIPAGEYDITATKAGWANGSLLDVEIEGATTFVAPQIVMVQNEVDLAGYVSDDSHVDLPNAAVTLTPIYGAYTPLYSTTDINGDWSVMGVKAGLYSLKVEKAGFVTQTRDLNAMDSTAATILAPDIMLPAVVAPGTANANGYVEWDHDADPGTAREPLGDVKVSFTPEGEDLPIVIVFSDGLVNLGEWEALDLPLGIYTAKFEKYGMSTVEVTLAATVSDNYDMGTVVMIPGLTTDPVAVSGKVYDELATPLYDVKVVFTPQFAWGYDRTTYTNEEGSFNVPSMIAGMYEMEISKGTATRSYLVDLTVGGVDYNLGTFELVMAP